MLKQIVLLSLSAGMLFTVHAQSALKIITAKQVKKIEKVLSADDMQGRRTFTPGIDKASAFIETQFRKAGLQTFNGSANYRQEFSMTQAETQNSKIVIDGKAIPDSLTAIFSYQPSVSLTEKSDVEIVKINAGDKFGPKFYEYYQSKKNLLVLVDSSFSNRLKNIQHIDKITSSPGSNTVVFVFGTKEAAAFSVECTNTISKKSLNNVVGVLPGKSKPDEYVVFSGHYDHLGVGSPAEGAPHGEKDSIYNGANDDAAGTTAVIMLARYFAKLNNNERTLVFTTFVAEELGGFGSQYFSKQLAPEKVMAMFNIEMIGTESKWGTKSAYITGFEKSNMGKILQENLKGSSFNFYPDPYPEQQLFYRSDNATLARLGVPAHTISTSKMDDEKNYHTASDEIGTLDMKNMAEIIKAIALSSATIISGKDTPSRVDATQLK
ncbi:M20/M25/M40 family metallo-hydrolase [Ferruginibacter paludis]|uniref:M28 family peptidase n=1 Tax=Ferruginibacter paludis TaxID=1310417 RepID=UPI0025B2FDF0|nr:M28 family peptidase [Ferruginibacter paludis]MDN3656339.1 M20/M25/M40 family metallo-hydrolase [Ferruginibacter paludis]